MQGAPFCKIIRKKRLAVTTLYHIYGSCCFKEALLVPLLAQIFSECAQQSYNFVRMPVWRASRWIQLYLLETFPYFNAEMCDCSKKSESIKLTEWKDNVEWIYSKFGTAGSNHWLAVGTPLLYILVSCIFHCSSDSCRLCCQGTVTDVHFLNQWPAKGGPSNLCYSRYRFPHLAGFSFSFLFVISIYMIYTFFVCASSMCCFY